MNRADKHDEHSQGTRDRMLGDPNRSTNTKRSVRDVTSTVRANESSPKNAINLITWVLSLLLAVNGTVQVPTEQQKRSEERELSMHLARLEYSRHRRNLLFLHC